MPYLGRFDASSVISMNRPPQAKLAFMHPLRFERALLDHHHEAIVAEGVQSYDATRARRRLPTVGAISEHNTRAALRDIPPGIWWNNLERILLAIDDLGCRELLCASCLSDNEATNGPSWQAAMRTSKAPSNPQNRPTPSAEPPTWPLRASSRGKLTICTHGPIASALRPTALLWSHRNGLCSAPGRVEAR
jgi:hypothetical protein